jgi:hypothetical protein
LVFELQQNQKIDFVKKGVMRKNSRFSVIFSGFFPTLLKTILFIILSITFDTPNQVEPTTQLPTRRKVKNRSIITTPKSDDRHKKKNKKIKKKHYCKIKTFTTPFRI